MLNRVVANLYSSDVQDVPVNFALLRGLRLYAVKLGFLEFKAVADVVELALEESALFKNFGELFAERELLFFEFQHVSFFYQNLLLE